MKVRNNRFWSHFFLMLSFFAAVALFSGCGGGGGSTGSVVTPTNTDDTSGATGTTARASITGYVIYGETASFAAPGLSASRAASAGGAVSGATVELRSVSDPNGSPIQTKTTSSTGKFAFTDVGAGNYFVTAKALDGATLLSSESRVDVTAGKYDYYVATGAVELKKAFRLNVLVTDQDGSPIFNSLVTLDDIRGAVTGSDGVASFAQTPSGPHSVWVVRDSFRSKLESAPLSGADSTVTVSLLGSASTAPLYLTLSDIASSTSSAEIYENDVITLSSDTSNPNSGVLSFAWSADGGTFASQKETDAGSGRTRSEIKWTAPAVNFAAGQFYAFRNVSVKASDQKGAEASKTIQFKVLKRNVSKIAITSVPPSDPVDIGNSYAYQMQVAGSSELKFELIDAPSGMTIGSNGLISWTPSLYGQYTAAVRVTETAGGYFAIQRFVVTAARSIPPISGTGISKTVLKPGSGLSTIVQALSDLEYLIVIPYNVKKTAVSYQISAVPQTASSAQQSPAASPKVPEEPPSLSAAPAVSGQMASDSRMRRNESRISSLSGGASASRAPGAAAALPMAVGDKKSFYSLNSLTYPPSLSDWTQVTATLRGIGTHCYIFEDDRVVSPYIALTDTDVKQFISVFDNEIYPKDTEAFGAEPNPGIDSDSKIYILFTHNVNRQTASGYFDSTNQVTQAFLNSSADYNNNSSGYKYFSNEKEMFYMAVPKETFQGSEFRVHSFGVLAHEFQHMINWYQHDLRDKTKNEDAWVNEGLSQVAQDICGYGYQYGTLAFVISPYLRSPESFSLTNFEFNLGCYGNSYLFIRYVVDRGADPKRLVQTAKIGKLNILDELIRVSIASTFDEAFEDFAAALYLSNLGVTSDAKYNFKNLNIRSAQNDNPPTVLSGARLTSQIASGAGTYSGSSLREYGLNFVKITGASTSPTLKFTMTDPNTDSAGAVVLRVKK